jgi:hypothetical protein
MAASDFIELHDGMLAREHCAQIIEFFERSGQAQPGHAGGRVAKNTKDSDDITISGRPEWHETERLLNRCVTSALVRYLRRHPYLLLGPRSVRRLDASGNAVGQLDADDVACMPEEGLAELVTQTFALGTINLQRYRANTGGYPHWHCEVYPSNDPLARTLHRQLFWIIYLNDTFSAGETEFIHQRRKVQPRAGRLVLAPAAFTHTHRGNRPLGGDKYIATSWVLFP